MCGGGVPLRREQEIRGEISNGRNDDLTDGYFRNADDPPPSRSATFAVLGMLFKEEKRAALPGTAQIITSRYSSFGSVLLKVW